MTFAEIERVTGTKLPEKSQHSRAWWSNNPSNSVLTRVWRDAGFESAEVDMKGRKLVFRRVRNPLFGAMKGTFSVDPSWDLTKPTMSDEDLAEMEANIHRTADLIDAGAKGMSKEARDCKQGPLRTEPSGDRHPLIGWMKDTFWIDPNWDLTKPALDLDELAQLFANIERTADLIEAGLTRKKKTP